MADLTEFRLDDAVCLLQLREHRLKVRCKPFQPVRCILDLIRAHLCDIPVFFLSLLLIDPEGLFQGSRIRHCRNSFDIFFQFIVHDPISPLLFLLFGSASRRDITVLRIKEFLGHLSHFRSKEDQRNYIRDDQKPQGNILNRPHHIYRTHAS